MYYPYRNLDFKPTDINTYEQMFHQFSNMEHFESMMKHDSFYKTMLNMKMHGHK